MMSHKKKGPKYADQMYDIWASWFIKPVDKDAFSGLDIPNLKQLLANLNMQSFKAKDLENKKGVPDQVFLADKLKIAGPPTKECFDLPRVLLTRVDLLLPKQDQIQKVLPFLYRIIIHFTCNFELVFRKATVDNECLGILDGGLVVLDLLSRLPRAAHLDAFILMRDAYTSLSRELRNRTISPAQPTLVPFCDRLVDLSLRVLDAADDDHFVSSEMHLYLCQNFVTWYASVTTEGMYDERMRFCQKIAKSLFVTAPNVMPDIKEQVALPMVHAGFNAMTMIVGKADEGLGPQKSFRVMELPVELIIRACEKFEATRTIIEDGILDVMVQCILWANKTFVLQEMFDTDVSVPSDWKGIDDHENSEVPLWIEDRTFAEDIPLAASMTPLQIGPMTDHYKKLLAKNRFLSSLLVLLVKAQGTPLKGELAACMMNAFMTAETENDAQKGSFLLFLVEFLHSYDPACVNGLCSKCDGWRKLFGCFAFEPKNTYIDPNSPPLVFAEALRNAVYTLFVYCYDKTGNKKEFESILIEFLERAEPQAAEEICRFIYTLKTTCTTSFNDMLLNSQFLEEWFEYERRLQRCHVFAPQEAKVQVGSGRKMVLLFFLPYYDDTTNRAVIFRDKATLNHFKRLLFEDRTSKYASDMIRRVFACRENGTTMKELLKIYSAFVVECGQKASDKRWADIATKMICMFKRAACDNKKLLVPIMHGENVLPLLLSVLDKLVSEFGMNAIGSVNEMIGLVSAATVNQPEMQKAIGASFLAEFAAVLRKVQFGVDTIVLILELVFEQKMLLNKLPETIDIRFTHALPFLHLALYHVDEHEKVMNYLASLCEKSFTNIVAVYKSKLPLTILDYIQSFDVLSKASDREKRSLEAVFLVFKIVAKRLFKPKTMLATVHALRLNEDGTKSWWNARLLQCLEDVLSAQVTEDPASFFHFKGIDTGLTIQSPEISVSRGFTVLVRFLVEDILGNFSENPKILSMEAGNIVEIGFTGRKLAIFIPNGNKESEFEIQPKKWYNLCVCCQDANCKIYMDTQKVLEAQLDLFASENQLKKCEIARGKSPADCLVCNVSQVCIFAQVLKEDVIDLLASLPTNYVYNFSASNGKTFPNLPQSLFDGHLESALEFCYNSRMSDGVKCANLSSHNSTSAFVAGIVVPFSSSFCGAAASIGGIGTFMPLLEQADAPVRGSEEDDSPVYLQRTLSLFAMMQKNSSELENSLFLNDHIKAMAYLLGKVNRVIITDATIMTIHDMYASLRVAEHRTLMFKYLIMNSNVWSDLPPNFHNALIDTLFTPITTNMFPENVPFMSAFLYVWMLETPECRVQYYPWLLQYAAETLQPLEISEILKFCFSSDSQVLRLEALKLVMQLVKQKIRSSHLYLSKNSRWIGSLTDLASDSCEDIRITAFDILMQIYIFASKDVIPAPAVPLDKAVNGFISHYCHDHLTEKTWAHIREIFFTNLKLAGSLLPLLAYLSHNISEEIVAATIQKLIKSISVLQSACDSLAGIPMLELYVFYLYTQSQRPVLVFEQESTISSFFAAFWISLITNKRIERLQESLTALRRIHMTKKWNLVPILRQIMVKMLESDAFLSEGVYEVVVSLVFSFMFFIPKHEEYYNNVELLWKYEVYEEPTDLSEMVTSFDLNTFLTGFNNLAPEFVVAFNARVTRDGDWVDYNLACLFCSRVMEKKAWLMNMCSIYTESFRVFELLAYTDGFIIRITPTKLKATMDSLMASVTSVEDCVTGLAIFTSFVAPTANQTKETRNYFESLTRAVISLYEKQKIEDIVDFYAMPSGEWLDRMNHLMPQCAQEWNKARDRLEEKMTALAERVQPTSDTMRLSYLRTEVDKSLKTVPAACKKAFKHLKEEWMLRAGGWESNKNDPIHWMLSKQVDSQFQHFTLKPNRNFDKHERIHASGNEEGFAMMLKSREIASNDEELEDDDFMNELLDCNDVTESESSVGTVETAAPPSPRPSKLTQLTDFVTSGWFGLRYDAKMITIRGVYAGKFSMNRHDIIFEGRLESNPGISKSDVICVQSLTMVLHRNVMHLHCGLEMFTDKGKSYFFFFNKKKQRSRIIRAIQRLKTPKLTILQTGSIQTILSETKITEQWKSGAMSNYEYLMYLNLFGGRSFNDLSQYPVFPWVVADYTSDVLDLSDPKSFRDLSKPIAAMSPQRLEKAKKSAELGRQTYLYNIHYSNAFTVCYYMMRLEPYTTQYVQLQDGKFDLPSRIFVSLPELWQVAAINTQQESRELIPEFFTTPQLLKNSDGFDFGTREDGTQIGDLILPNWATSPEDFIAKHREALESDYVRAHLNEWIDLVFGFKQTGPAAVEADNTFHPFSYSECITKEVKQAGEKLHECQMFALHFGITPKRLFTMPHPQSQHVTPLLPAIANDLTITPIMWLSSRVLFVASDAQTVFALSSDAKMRLGTEKDIDMSQYMSSLSELTEKSFCYDNYAKTLVVSSVWDSAIHFFRVEPTGASLLRSVQQFSLVCCLNKAGSGRAVCASRDMSITLWGDGQQFSKSTLHHYPIVDLVSSQSLDLLISCDKRQNVVLSVLSTGQYIRSFVAPVPVNSLLMTTNYFILVGESNHESVLISYGMDTTEISRKSLGSLLTASVVFEFSKGKYMVAAALQNKTLLLMSLPSLNVEFSTDLSFLVTTMGVDYRTPRTLLAVGDGNIVYTLKMK